MTTVIRAPAESPAGDLAFLADAAAQQAPAQQAPACLACGGPLADAAVVVHVQAPGGDYDLCGRCAAA